jgi:hypothetical protein
MKTPNRNMLSVFLFFKEGSDAPKLLLPTALSGALYFGFCVCAILQAG